MPRCFEVTLGESVRRLEPLDRELTMKAKGYGSALAMLCLFVAWHPGGSPRVRADETPQTERLKQSLELWEKVREGCGGNYSYRVTRSFFTGARETTIVTVTGDKVTERRLEIESPPAALPPGERPPGPVVKWRKVMIWAVTGARRWAP